VSNTVQSNTEWDRNAGAHVLFLVA
jgi:hypothetical protein